MTSLQLDVEIVLDVTALDYPPSDGPGLAALWREIEPDLHGWPLPAAGHRFTQHEGVIVEIVRTAPGVAVVGPRTRFGVVAVRERAALRHRCRPCGENGHDVYGPFVCRSCAPGRGRLCDEHVLIVDGALTAACPEHVPSCSGCGNTATFWCNGPQCKAGRAWCSMHRHPHPHDTAVDFCRGCLDEVFPSCSSPRCPALGMTQCEHRASDGRACGTRLCSQHAHRWQVFGGERLGLARCGAHRDTTVLSPDDVLFQIITGAAWRRRPERLPSLAGFADNLRRVGHRRPALDLRGIYQRLTAPDPRLPDVPRTTRALDGATPSWREQLADWEEAQRTGAELVERLRRLVVADAGRRGEDIAAVVRLAEYKSANARRDRAILYVHLPAALRGALIGTRGARIGELRGQLGVDVRFEGDG